MELSLVILPLLFFIYNGVDSGLAAAECTLLDWLARNCARAKCRLKERAELSW